MGEKEKLISDREFKEELLVNFNELREENVLCDATLRIEGQDFAAHRCVLSAASPYFRSLFTSGFKENESNVIELQERKSAAAANEVLRFIYTGEILINASNAQDLYKVADYLIIPSLKTNVSEYLKESIDATNCLALELFASQFGCESLEQAAVAFKLGNFVSLVKTDDFKALDFQKVKQLISHDEIIVSREEEVYEAVVSWVKHDILSRKSLLKCLRLFSMSKHSLYGIQMEDLVTKNTTCSRIIHEGWAFVLFPDTFLDRSLKSRACLNNSESVVILTGGHNDTVGPGVNSTNGLLLSKKRWLSLPAIPFPHTRHGTAVCCGQLYVVGGKTSAPMCTFNPKQNKWIAHEKELTTRLHCSVTALNELLYVMGGHRHWDSTGTELTNMILPLMNGQK